MIPPIEEVGCSFRFNPGMKWNNLSIIDRLKPLRDRYPFIEGMSEKGVSTPINEGGENPDFDMIQLSDETHTRRLMITDRMIIFQQQGPYNTWAETKGNILYVLKTVQSRLKTKSFRSVGLRYINKIVIKGRPIRIRDYFNMGPDFRGPLDGQKFIDFSVKVTMAYGADDYCKVRLLRVIPEKKDESYPVLLDLYYNSFSSITNQDFEGWLETAHNNTEKLFNSCITDKARALFEKESND